MLDSISISYQPQGRFRPHSQIGDLLNLWECIMLIRGLSSMSSSSLSPSTRGQNDMMHRGIQKMTFHCYCHCHLINFKKCYKYHLYSVTTLFRALSLEDSPKHKIARLWFWMKLWTWTAHENLQVWLNLLNKMLWTKVLGDGARSMHFTIKIRWDKDHLIMLNCSLTGSMRESLTWSVNWKLKRRNQP